MPTSDQKCIDLDHREVARFYDDVYYRNVSGKAKPSGHLLRLAARLDIRPGQTVLDIACGTGDWLDVASTNGLDVAGIDISTRAIEVCRERMPAGEFHVAFFYALVGGRFQSP